MNFVWTFSGCMEATLIGIIGIVFLVAVAIGTYKDWKAGRVKK